MRVAADRFGGRLHAGNGACISFLAGPQKNLDRFHNKDFVAFSIETRKEQGEGYSTLKGFFKQFELTYVVGDERDLIRVRTDYRNPPEDVYLYRLKIPRGNARKFFMEYIRQINSMKETPEWYNTTLTTNCTTNIVRHVRAFGARRNTPGRCCCPVMRPGMPTNSEHSIPPFPYRSTPIFRTDIT